MKIIISVILAILLIAGLAFFYLKPIEEESTIAVVSPIKDSEISSPLSISGRAKGTWFFEGSFPVTLFDSNRNTIAEGHVTAQGEWMTEEFVPFLGTLQFNNFIKGSSGFLVLKKDNPSGLKEHDESIEIPIMFK